MLVTRDYVKALLGLETNAHDALIDSLIATAQGIAEQYIGQPIERATLHLAAPCAASATSEWGVVVLPASIDVTIVSAYAGGVDVTSVASVLGGLMHLPTDYIGLMVEADIESGWTPATVPPVVQHTLAQIAAYYFRRSAASRLDLSGVRSLSTSDGGVVTSSTTLIEDELMLYLRQLQRWRRL